MDDNINIKQELNIIKINNAFSNLENPPVNEILDEENKIPKDEEVSEHNILSVINHIQLKKWYTTIQLRIKDFELTTIALVDYVADLTCIQEGLIPSKYFEKSKESLSSANGSKMNIKYEIPRAHICQSKVCYKTSFVLVKNLTDRLILGLPFITLIYHFLVNYDGIITCPFDEPVKFNFLSNPEIHTLKALQENSVTKTINRIQTKNK